MRKIALARPNPIRNIKTIRITVPEILLLDPLQTLAGLERRSQFNFDTLLQRRHAG